MSSTKALVTLAIAASGLSGALHAQTVLNVYGPGGPAPAMLEAAKAFGTAHSISVIVVAGPTPQWVEKAKQDADDIFSGSENMSKNIRGFRDLLAPNIKVLTVAGAGQPVCGKTWQGAPET